MYPSLLCISHGPNNAYSCNEMGTSLPLLLTRKIKSCSDLLKKKSLAPWMLQSSQVVSYINVLKDIIIAAVTLTFDNNVYGSKNNAQNLKIFTRLTLHQIISGLTLLQIN